AEQIRDRQTRRPLEAREGDERRAPMLQQRLWHVAQELFEAQLHPAFEQERPHALGLLALSVPPALGDVQKPSAVAVQHSLDPGLLEVQLLFFPYPGPLAFGLALPIE